MFDPCVSPALTTLTALYSHLGDINDDINAYQYYKDNNQDTKADAAKQQIITDWSNLQQWAVSKEISVQFQCLMHTVLYHYQ